VGIGDGAAEPLKKTTKIEAGPRYPDDFVVLRLLVENGVSEKLCCVVVRLLDSFAFLIPVFQMESK